MTYRYLFDSHALLAFFQSEEGAEVVAEIMRKAEKESLDRLICVINLGEIVYVIKRRFGDTKKLEIIARIHQLGIRILPVPESIVFRAAEIKAEYPISFADCFALACSEEYSAVLVTGDPDFKKTDHLVDIKWIR